VDAFTKDLRIDLLEVGIKKTQVAPGAVETEFSQARFHGDEVRAMQVYKGFRPLTAQDVAGVAARLHQRCGGNAQGAGAQQFHRQE
jgi:NADP-dependent 3-hydroxy acid dehydrogenase YdfG